MAPDEFDLLQRQHDGELTPGELRRVEALLAASPEARATAAALKALAAGLDAGEQVEIPAGSVHEIMARVQARPHPAGQSFGLRLRQGAGRIIGNVSIAVSGSGSRVEEVMSNRSKIVWGVSSTAAVVLVGLWAAGLIPPAQDGGEATIGAAKRYQATQIAGKDVAVTDSEAQAFMQSETFDRLLKDPDARKALASPEMRTMLKNAQVRDALAQPEFAAALRGIANDAALSRAFADQDFAAAISKSSVAAALSDAEMQAALADNAVAAALSTSEARSAFSAAEFSAAFSDASLMRALGKADVQAALRDAQFRSALADPAVRAKLADAQLKSAIADADLTAALSSAEVRTALASASVQASPWLRSSATRTRGSPPSCAPSPALMSSPRTSSSRPWTPSRGG